MLDKLAKIEDSANNVLSKIGVVLLIILKPIFPKKLYNKFLEKVLLLRSKIYKTKKWVITSIMKLIDTLKTGLGKIQGGLDSGVNKLQNFPYKQFLQEKQTWLKTFILKTPRKQKIVFIKSVTEPHIKKAQKLVPEVDTSGLKLAGISLGIITVGLLISFFFGKEIYRSEFPYRAPASIQEYDYRPDYLMYEKQSVKIFTVKVPVIIEDVNDLTTVTIDFSIRTSTRFARYYIEKYEYKVKDYFFSGVEPVVSDFPLEREGKDILKEKIREELNIFLEQENVEGEVLEVHITYIVGS